MVVVGYNVCHFLDHLNKQNALDAIHDEEHSWQPDPEDPETEENEHLCRVKLSGEHQIMMYRVGDYLRRML